MSWLKRLADVIENTHTQGTIECSDEKMKKLGEIVARRMERTDIEFVVKEA